MSRKACRCSPLFVALAAALMLPGRAAAQQGAAPRRATAEAYVDAITRAKRVVEEQVSERGVPGIAAAVYHDEQLRWADGLGYADVEQRSPVWPSTRFRIGSVSKSLTAAALGLLVEDGLLDLDAPVQTYVPSFPRKRAAVTTRQLGGHLAGIRHYRGDEFLSRRRYGSVTEALQVFEDDSLLFAPGTRYSYSSYGWNLISAVIEGASGDDFLTVMQQRVFGPLGMRHTGPDRVDSIIPQRTGYYERGEDGDLLKAPAVDNSVKWAGGGFLSSAEDLVRFGAAHLEPGFLRAETLELLFTSQRTSDGVATGYGIGWRVDRDGEGRRRVWHSGGSVGGSTALLLYPEERLVVAVIANLSDAPQVETATAIAQAFLAPGR